MSTVIYDSISQLDLTLLHDFYASIKAIPLNTIAKGELIRVAVLDSGIDYMHDYLANRIYGVFDILRNTTINSDDKLGHGTHIAGLIGGKQISILSNCRLYAVKITDDYGNLAHETVIDGLRWCIYNNIDVVCMAFGTTEYDPRVEAVIKQAAAKGMTLIASAGNNPETIEYPAKFPEVLSVGGVDYALQRAAFSPTGLDLDIVMPAVDIPSLYSYNRFATMSGSSPATAIATVVVTILQQLRRKYFKSTYNIYQLRKWIARNSIDLGELGFDEEYGLGVPTLQNVYEELVRTDFKPKKVF